MAKLLGKVALITGSSRGIGSAIALKLAEYGADVAVNIRKMRMSRSTKMIPIAKPLMGEEEIEAIKEVLE